MAGGQQLTDARLAHDVVDKGGHLREAAGRERVPAKDEGYDAYLAGVSEQLLYLLSGSGDGVPGGEERHVCALRRLGAQRAARGQRNGYQKEKQQRYVGAGRYQSAQPVKCLHIDLRGLVNIARGSRSAGNPPNLTT